MIEHKCKGIILKLKEHGESDQIVCLFTDQWGKQTFRAPFARKSKKRFLGLLQTFAQHNLVFQQKKQTWPVLLRVEPITLYQGFRQNLSGFAAASYASELLLRLTEENDPNPALYSLLSSFLSYCEATPLSPKALCRFHLRLLQDLGLQPNWQLCMECGQQLQLQPSCHFEFESGGIICGSCFHHANNRLRTSPLLPSLRTLLAALQERQVIPLEKPIPWKDAVELLDKRISGLLGNQPRSRTFLQEMVGF